MIAVCPLCQRDDVVYVRSGPGLICRNCRDAIDALPGDPQGSEIE